MSSSQKKKLVLFTCLVFLGLFIVPQAIHADMFGITDIAGIQLDALDFIDNSVMRYLVLAVLLAIESVTFLNISANLLDFTSRLPVTLNDNALVNAGWHFTSGLANLSFILIFVAIALAYVFKLETFGMKKALPRLIIIALLVNFSLLFVKMLSDIGWIFQNSFSAVFFKESGSFAAAAANALTESNVHLITTIVGVLFGYIAVSVVPYINAIALIGITGLVLGTGGLGGSVGGLLTSTISQTVLMIIINFAIGLIFFIFAALFLIRIAAIWLLAIFAPLAFISFILPNTKKYFDQWMKALLQWILLGVVVFFLMGLGLMLFGLVAPGGQESLVPGQFFDVFYKYIFLLIYMIVVFITSRKLVPIGTQMIWGLGEKTVKNVPGWGAWAGQKAGEWGRKRLPEGVRKWGEKEAMVATPREARGAAALFYTTRRRLGAALGPGAVATEKQRIAQIEESIKKEEGLPSILKRYRDAKDDPTRIAVINTLIKRQKIDDAMDVKAMAQKYGISPLSAQGLALDPREIDAKYQKAKSWGVEDVMTGGLLQFPRIKSSVTQLPHNPATGKPETLGEAMGRQILGKMKKADDWKNISKGVLSDSDAMEAILKTATGSQLGQILETHQIDAANAIRNSITTLAQKDGYGTNVQKWLKERTRLQQYFITGAGAMNYGIKV